MNGNDREQRYHRFTFFKEGNSVLLLCNFGLLHSNFILVSCYLILPVRSNKCHYNCRYGTKRRNPTTNSINGCPTVFQRRRVCNTETNSGNRTELPSLKNVLSFIIRFKLALRLGISYQMPKMPRQRFHLSQVLLIREGLHFLKKFIFLSPRFCLI